MDWLFSTEIWVALLTLALGRVAPAQTDTTAPDADTISVLVAGRVIASGQPDAIRQSDDVKRAYLGDEALPEAHP